MKSCSKCKQSKHLDSFSFRDKSKGTRTSTCKDCQKALSAEWYLKNTERQKANVRKNKNTLKKVFDLDAYLVVDSLISNKVLKRRLLEKGYLANKCYSCGLLPEWNGKPITLQMDHINGNNRDNRLENLRILCPNCHSQTDTWCGRNQTRYGPT